MYVVALCHSNFERVKGYRGEGDAGYGVGCISQGNFYLLLFHLLWRGAEVMVVYVGLGALGIPGMFAVAEWIS
jgi:hypothetical protein